MMESKKKISQKRKYHNKTLIKLIIKGFVSQGINAKRGLTSKLDEE